jgi:asparagine synthase (glutamine-hydrolysing)
LANKSFSINEKHLLRYLVNGYKALGKTSDQFFKEIDQLPPATSCTVDAKFSPKYFAYWKPAFKEKPITLQKAIHRTADLLEESMRLRLRSDVPLAFCLSGGVDSAGLVSLAKKNFKYDVATYSIIDPDERYNELNNIKATVEDLKCKNKLILLEKKGHLEKLKKLIAYHDQPVSTISYLVHSYLSEAIAADGYKVAISGTGADELFTGYYDHFNMHLYEIRKTKHLTKALKDWEEGVGKTVRNPFLQNPRAFIESPSERRHIYLDRDDFRALLKKDFREDFSERKYTNSLLRNRMLNEMFEEVIPVILKEDDLNSMCYSIENRSPYLDRHLFEFVYSVPSEYLIQQGFSKFLLREALKGILNESVRLDKRKVGFNASISSLVDFKNKKDRNYLLEDSPVFKLVDRTKMERLFDMENIPNSYSKFIFNFINAKIFLEQNQA